MNRRRLIELTTVPLFWGVLILGALQAKHLVSASKHSICGPWGCGPTTDSLLAIHLGTLAIICPPLIFLPLRLGLAKRSISRMALALLILGVGGIAVIVAWQWFVWLPQSSTWARSYIWQRCGFAILTAVDLPFLQLTLASLGLIALNHLRDVNVVLHDQLEIKNGASFNME